VCFFCSRIGGVEKTGRIMDMHGMCSVRIYILAWNGPTNGDGMIWYLLARRRIRKDMGEKAAPAMLLRTEIR